MSGPANNDGGFSTQEDTPLTLTPANLLANDPAGTSILDIGNAVGGTVGFDVNGNIIFTPSLDYTGAASFEYVAMDDMGEISIATVSLTVNGGGGNVAPVATADSGFTTSEDTPLFISGSVLRSNDTDSNGDAISITGVANSVGGSAVLDGAGNITFTPTANYNGPASFTYTISDGHGGFSSATVSLTVTPVNDAPVAVANSFNATEDTAITLTPGQLLSNDSDVDGNPLSIAGVTNAVGGTVILNAQGNVVFTPSANYNGAASFTYTVSDGQGGFANATVVLNVAAVNDKPIVVNESFSMTEDTPLHLSASQLLSNDSDIEGGTLSILAVSTAVNGTVSKDAQGNVTFTPAADYNGPASFKYIVSDGQGGFTTGTVNLTIAPANDAPVALNDSFTMAEDGVLTLAPAQLLGNDLDADGNTLTIQSVQTAAGGSVALQGGNVVFTPTANYNGPASFTYTVSDGNGGTSTATVNLTVTPVNDAPVAVANSFSTNEDTALSLTAAQLLGNDSDIDGDTLSIQSVQGAVGGSVSIDGSGNVVFTPTANHNGAASFTYTISDGHGGTSTATVGLTVNPVNDAPVAVANSGFSTAEDTALTIAPASLLGNDTDIDGDTLSIASVQDAVGGSVSIDGSGNVVFTPAANYNGAASFTYTISDSNGGTSTATVSLSVTPVNDAPVAVANSGFSTAEDTALSIAPASLLGNDTDVDGNTLSIASVQDAVGGSVSIDGSGNVVFTPTANYNGAASFTYTISDGNGGTSTAAVNLTVTPVQDAPVAVANSFSTNEDVALSLTPAQLLGNDSDPDGDTLSIASVQAATGGSVSIDGSGNVVFTPTANYSGAAGFTYTISDGQGGTSTATVSLTVNPVNDAPVANGDSGFTTLEDTPVTIAASSLLANDTDLEGNTLSIQSVQDAVGGSVAFDQSGNVVFTPGLNYNGGASFTYTVSDGNGGTSTATVNLSVTPVTDAAVAVNDSVTLYEDGSEMIFIETLLGNDSNPEGHYLNMISVQGAVNGTVALGDFNSVIFTPTANYNGPASFTYTIGDGLGGTTTATVNVTVLPTNDVPIAVDDYFYIRPGEVVNTSLAALFANDIEPDGDTLMSFGFPHGGVNGDVYYDFGTGNIVFTPTAGFTGMASFTYSAWDGGNQFDVGTVHVAVLGDEMQLSSVGNRITTGMYGITDLQAGNVNGDGAVDLLARTAAPDHTSANHGVIFGQSGSLTSALNGGDFYSGTGSQVIRFGGYSYTVGLADVNADGVQDALHAIGSYGGVSTLGVLLGGSGVDAVDDTSLNSGIGYAGGSAMPVSADFNGDGRADLFLSVHNSSAYNGSASATTPSLAMWLGGVGGISGSPVATAYSGINGIGSASAANVAYVMGAVDINNDGFDDIVTAVGARNDGSAVYGPVKITFGNAAGILASDLSSNTGGLILNNFNVGGGDLLTRHMAGGGDVNGDGIEDMVGWAGTYPSMPTGAFVLYGNTSYAAGGSVDIAALNGLNGMRITGVSAGISSMALGDLNGDGIDDIVVGSSGANKAWVIWGQQGGIARSIDLSQTPTATSGFMSFSGTSGQGIGSAVTVADMDGDGKQDLVIGSSTGTIDVVSGDLLSHYAAPLSGNDTLTGTGGDDTIFGHGGGDMIFAGNGNDILVGGDGQDVLQGEAGSDTLYGGAGDDSLNGGTGDDYMEGGNGGDRYVIDSAGDVVVENGTGGEDFLFSSITASLANYANIESIVLEGTANVNATGNAGVNKVGGNTGDNILTGGGGDDILVGMNGNDTYVVGRGDGIDSIYQSSAPGMPPGITDAATTTDTLRFLSGVSYDQLWFSHVGNDLRIDVIGETASSVLMKDWYSDASRRVDVIETADGSHALTSGNVEALVTAMAGFSAPAPGTFTLDSQVANDLAPVFATTWA